jgi:hypothetical protein
VSKENERVAITQHFSSFWAANYPAYPVAWPNHEFTTPSNTLFVVFNLVDRGTSRETIGRTYIKRHRGTLQLDIYMPAGAGVKVSRQIGDALELTYDSLDLPVSDGRVIMFRTPSAREISANEARASNLEDNWSRYIVECPYDCQKITVA